MLFNRIFLGVLRDPNGDGNTGGGGGTGAGSGEGGAAGNGALTPEAVTQIVNAAVNGLDKKYRKLFEGLKTPASTAAAKTPAEDDEGEGDPSASAQNNNAGGDGSKPRKDPEVARLKRQLEETNKRLADSDAERAREKESAKHEKLDAAVRRELAKYPFIDDDNFEAGYAAVSRGIKYDDDGNLVGGSDELPLREYVEQRMKKLNTLLRPKEINGAGAANGGKPNAGTEVDLDSIKPGMTKEAKAALYAHIERVRS